MEMNPKDAQHMAQVVMAGMKLMYDKQTRAIMMKGVTRKNIPIAQRLATETAGLMKMLWDRSEESIPKQILIPAALAIMAEMAKFVTDAGFEKPTKQDMDAAKDMLVKIMHRMYGDKPAAPPGPPRPQGGLMMSQPMGA